MKIQLYEPALARPGGFFTYVFNALIRECGATFTQAPRPLPQLHEPREHVSAWLEIDGTLVFLDMSDHVFLHDLNALRLCGVYLKTNLNRAVSLRVLQQEGLSDLGNKLQPFFSFAGFLNEYLRPSPLRTFYDRSFGQKKDLCHIVGVYEHLRRDGEASVYEDEHLPVTPNRAHYWARVHTLEALQQAGFTGTFRLTSRGVQSLEDSQLIFPNRSQRAYRRSILNAKALVINTLPHALLPWKATEALALGRPFLLDIHPQTEFPDAFALREGDHFLTLLPAPSGFDPDTDLDDPAAWRILHRYRLDDFEEGASRAADLLREPGRLAHMRHEVAKFRDQALSTSNVASFILNSIPTKAPTPEGTQPS